MIVIVGFDSDCPSFWGLAVQAVSINKPAAMNTANFFIVSLLFIYFFQVLIGCFRRELPRQLSFIQSQAATFL